MSWPTVKLGDIFDISSSKRVHQEDWREEGVPFYRAREVVILAKDGVVENNLFIEEAMYEEYKEKYGVPQEDDILVTAVGTLGQTYAVKKDDRFYFKDASVILLRKKTEVNIPYILHALNSVDVQRIIKKSDGATVGTYTISRAKETEIPLPPLAEQKRIAAILDKADNLRRKRQQAIQLADDFLRAVFLDMFGDPVTNPKGWPIQNVEDVCTDIVDCINKTAKTVDYETPYKMIRTTNVRDYELDLTNCRFAEKDVYEKWVSRLVPEKDDIIFTREAPAGEAAIFNSDEKVFLGQRTMQFRPDQSVLNSCFLLYEMMGGGIKRQMDKMSSGSTVKHLSVPECKKFKVRTPPLEFQNKFKKIRNKILTLQHSESDAEALPMFDSVSQSAFSGEL
ncbi:type I restriction enzyme S subunit [Sinobacterium caligoides]|uniref:Type I restriction enzyme S subunit n=1 Tax=Sinobacterium caligoides TaxID=933926 RepID=A0A3N2DKI3_9GAMM|nr:restriction endonuclease subunit S [Sinobacterium caligoides]ROS00212.1 type I restriction enzyme S subunit [Sinobacterium caligoides]